jgi:hypothetical protein
VIDRLKRLGVVAALAVVLGTLLATASAQAQPGLNDTATQEPPTGNPCRSDWPRGWGVEKEFKSDEPGQACRECVAEVTRPSFFKDALRLAGVNFVQECQEFNGGLEARLIYAVLPPLENPPPEPGPAPVAAPSTCVGYVKNSDASRIPIDALSRSGQEHRLEAGQAWRGSDADPVVGFGIPYGQVHIEVEYLYLPNKAFLRRDLVNVARPQAYTVDPCHGVYVVARPLSISDVTP